MSKNHYEFPDGFELSDVLDQLAEMDSIAGLTQEVLRELQGEVSDLQSKLNYLREQLADCRALGEEP